jgi:hypothetical protein
MPLSTLTAGWTSSTIELTQILRRNKYVNLTPLYALPAGKLNDRRCVVKPVGARNPVHLTHLLILVDQSSESGPPPDAVRLASRELGERS